MRRITPFSLTALLIASSLSLSSTNAIAKKKRAHVAYERPVSVYTKSGQPNIQAQAAAVVDLDSGDELFVKNADAQRPIASISKLMAMLVVTSRKLDLDGVTTITEEDKAIAQRGARSRLMVGMSFTNRDLLHAALMASDNRAVPALGRATGLNPAQLVKAMNERAKLLGLKNTTFEDPVGLSANNMSTPRDLVRLLKATIAQPLIAEITQKAKYTAHAVNKPNYVVEYNNTDLVARSGKFDVLTGKTGYTDLALYCLAIAVKMSKTAAQDGERHVAMVFLGAYGKMTRFGDFSRAAQWLNERKLPTKTAAANATSL